MDASCFITITIENEMLNMNKYDKRQHFMVGDNKNKIILITEGIQYSPWARLFMNSGEGT